MNSGFFLSLGPHVNFFVKTLLSGCMVASSALSCVAEDDDYQWIQLFNGQDLEGWTPKFKGHEPGVNYLDTFRVEDGLLKVSYDKHNKFDDKFGHLFYKDSFSHYVLRAEYRVVGQQVSGGPKWAVRNNGLMIHGQAAETMRLEQDFPVSVEVQLLGGDGKHPRPTANLCTPGTNVVMDGKLLKRHCLESHSETFHGDQWVTVEVEVRSSGTIKHKVDGTTVLEYSQVQYDPRDADARRLQGNQQKLISGGTISIQAESHPFEFRKIELRRLAAPHPSVEN